jgi:hypothetical protein
LKEKMQNATMKSHFHVRIERAEVSEELVFDSEAGQKRPFSPVPFGCPLKMWALEASWSQRTMLEKENGLLALPSKKQNLPKKGQMELQAILPSPAAQSESLSLSQWDLN